MMKKIEIKRWLNNENYKPGIRYLIILALILAITVGLNTIVSKIPSSILFSDITVSGIKSLGNETYEKIDSLDKEVSIYLISREGKESKNTVKALDLYDKASDLISWEQLDPVREYKQIEKYSDGESIDNNGLIVISGNRHKVIQYSDYVMGSSFMLEDFLNSSIDYVSGKDLLSVYQLDSEHSTLIGETTANNMLLDGFQVKNIDIESGEVIPGDCKCLILNGIISDLSDKETDVIIDYIKNGGKVFLSTDYIEGSLKNLSKITNEFGASFGKGVVAESNSERFALDNAVNVIPNIDPSDEIITKGVEEVLMHMSMPIDIRETADVKSQVILVTTETAFYSYKNPLSGKVESGFGPFVIGAEFEKKGNNGTAEMVWISSAYIAHEGVNEYTDGSNITLFMNSICCMGNEEPKSSVYSGTNASRFISIDETSLKIWKAVIMFLIPLIVVLVGAAVIIRRRKR